MEIRTVVPDTPRSQKEDICSTIGFYLRIIHDYTASIDQKAQEIRELTSSKQPGDDDASRCDKLKILKEKKKAHRKKCDHYIHELLAYAKQKDMLLQ